MASASNTSPFHNEPKSVPLVSPPSDEAQSAPAGPARIRDVETKLGEFWGEKFLSILSGHAYLE